MRAPSVRAAAWVGLASVVFGGVFLAGRYTARADPGTPGGPSIGSIGFAGTLQQSGKGMPKGTRLTFTFKKQQAATMGDCPAVDVGVDPDPESGSFFAEIPLGTCSALFDGGDVFFDVSVGPTLVASGQKALATPYAKYADVANQVIGGAGWQKAGVDLHGHGQDRSAGRYLYSQYWNGGIPPCKNGVTTVAIEGPPEIGSTRNRVWTGTISVFGRTEGEIWYVQIFHHAHIFGFTAAQDGLDVVDIKPSLPGQVLSVTRLDDFSNKLYVNIPCPKDIQQLRIHIDVFVAQILGDHG